MKETLSLSPLASEDVPFLTGTGYASMPEKAKQKMLSDSQAKQYKALKEVKLMQSDTRCAFCGTPCQEYKGPDGKIYCADCTQKNFRKIALGLSELIKGAIR